MQRRTSYSASSALGEYAGMLIVLLILVAVFSSLTDHFFSLLTFKTLLNQIPPLTLVAIGMTFVLVTGEIDLSVGSVAALSGSVIGLMMAENGQPVWLAVPAAVLVGSLCGAVTGSISVFAGIPSFIVSLGVLQVARGLTYVVTDSQVVYIGSSVEAIGAGSLFLGVSPAFIMALMIAEVAHMALHRSLFGRYCIAIGFNENVVRYSGIDPRWPRIGAFVLSGTLAGLAGAVEVSRIGSVDPNAAAGLELSAIAAAVIGGTSLMGGRGSVIRTLFGVLAISVLQAGLSQMGARDAAKSITTGCVIVVAVLLDACRDRLKVKNRPN
jgi:ribose transport system permease protein